MKPVIGTFFNLFILQYSSLLLKKLFPRLIWNLNPIQKLVYLTFDDGPTIEVTEWVLLELAKYNFKATFFCIGKNIENHREIAKKIISEGHQIGNHSQLHENGWETNTADYIDSVLMCQSKINKLEIPKENLLFRPPYGKITRKQSKKLRQLGFRIIMWSNISKDYSKDVSDEECFQNSIKNLKNGDIIVFHDSYKAFENLKKTLPKTLEHLKTNGFKSESLF
jgi:peptidoglycan/xylan/chitin deacetylase (PgdA/CDA1 family)